MGKVGGRSQRIQRVPCRYCDKSFAYTRIGYHHKFCKEHPRNNRWCKCNKPQVQLIVTRGVICGICDKPIKQERERMVIV